MARAEVNLQKRSFVGGLNTEANPLTFPENATIDESNCDLLRDGSRRRRLGMDYEQDAVVIDSGQLTANVESLAITVHKWDNINNDASVGLVVVQVGNELTFFDLFSNPISGTQRNQGNPLTLSASVLAPSQPIQAVSISGGLVVVTGTKFVTLVEYNPDTDLIASRQFVINVRDFFGVDDNAVADTRPTSLSEQHNYNLLNQGWTASNITAFKVAQGVFPSNADIMFLGKNADGDFEPAEVVKQFFGNTPAPKGKFIIDSFDRGASRSSQSAVPVSGTSEGFGFLNPRPTEEL